MIFKILEQEHLPHERVVFCNDYKTGLKAIIAIHSTKLGVALGGCRMYPYATEQEALKDVLNLSRAMSYKAVFAGLKLGGGKSVIIGNPPKDKNIELLHAFGEYVESFGGTYIVAKDVGITDTDLKYIGEKTSHVVGKPKDEGGAGSPSYFTARGVFLGLKLGVKLKLQKSTLKGIKITIQGVGSVGKELMKLLLKEKAEVFVSDINEKTLKSISELYPEVHILPLDQVMKVPCDVFSPCALGGVLNENSLNSLDCSIIAGGANNQLASVDISQKLFDKDILYLPDFILNSGGLIQSYAFIQSIDPLEDWTEHKLQEIPVSLKSIYDSSKNQNISMTEAALQIAQQKIKQNITSTDQQLLV